MIIEEGETGTAVLDASPSWRTWARPRTALPGPRQLSERALAWCGGLILALMAGTLLFTRLDYPLLEPDESRYALIPLHMLQDGDWIVPHLQGKPYNDKPPLTYWLTALCYRLCGVQEWSSRLVPALAAWLTILAVYLWGCRWLGWRVALLSASILATMAGFVVMGRMLLLDGVLTLWVTLALMSGHMALARSTLHWGWWLTSAVCVGLGILTKGPVALVLVVPCLAAYRWLEPPSVRWRISDWPIYGGLAVGIAVPWYIAVMQRSDTFADDFFWRHHWMRFLKPYHHLRPWWFYGPMLLAELLPWTIVVGLWLATAWHRLAAQRRDWFATLTRWALKAWYPPRLLRAALGCLQAALPGSLRLGVVGACWCFLFFSASACKLPTYLMPILPLMALLMGQYVHQQQLHRLWFWSIAGSSAVLVGALWWGLPYYAGRASVGASAAHLAMTAEEKGIPVVAYRDDWDAAAFYRGGRELTVFPHHDSAALLNYLQQQPRTMVLVRGRADEFRSLLSSEFAIERTTIEGRVTAFIIFRQDG